MLDTYIRQISHNFIQEAKHSPMLLEDMAAMEKYMAESYSNRAFVELLQNADDAGATSVFITMTGKDLIVANNGRPFNEADINAISRSGSSGKERGKTIGYRGVGFKSTTSFSKQIVIYSNGSLFSFSKKQTARILGVHESKVPVVRIPFPVSAETLAEETRLVVRRLASEGYSSVFVFCDADKEICNNELLNISIGTVLFLRNIVDLSVDPQFHHMCFEIERLMKRDGTKIKIRDDAKGFSKEWLVHTNSGVSIALPLDTTQDDGVFHCFLPTLDTTGYGFRVNGDFSTDPSRKHITADVSTNIELEKVANLIAETIKKYVNDEQHNALFEGFAKHEPTNEFSAKLDLLVKRYLAQEPWISCVDGDKTSISGAIALPEWFSKEDGNIVASANPTKEKYVFSRNHSIYKMYIKLGVKTLSSPIFESVLSNTKYVVELSTIAVLIMLGEYIRFVRMQRNPDSCIHMMLNWSCVVNGQLTKLIDIIGSTSRWSDFLANHVPDKYQADFEWLYKKARIIMSGQTTLQTMTRITKPIRSIPHWRSAEEICVQIEIERGHNAIDVSRKNVGYDVLSEDDNGNPIYIEVKSVKTIGDAVTMTNNEYTCAHQYGDNYVLCLIAQNNVEMEVMYIFNPLINGRMEKRVRVWEWVVDSYHGERISFTLKE